MRPPAFGPRPALAAVYLEIRDLWEGGPTERRRSDAAVEARFRELRRHAPRSLLSPP